MNPDQLQRQLDLLADEELSPQEQRELFALLDRTPGGWRRCALALLEARCWQRALSHWAPDSSYPPQAAGSAQPRPACKPQAASRLEHLAWAAVAVALLVVGVAVGRWFPQPGALPVPQQAGQHRPLELAGTPEDQALLASPGEADAQPAPAPPAQREPDAAAPPGWPGFLAWQDTTPEGQPVHRLLPVPAAAALDGPALRPEDVFPRQWLQALQMLGHQIQVRRHWQAVPAADGTEVLIPRYEIHVVPVQATGIQ